MEKGTKEIIPEIGDEAPESWLQKAESEVRSSLRIIEVDDFHGNDKETKIYIRKPNVRIDSECAHAYSKKFSKLFSDGELKTNKEIEDMLEERGIWGKKEKDRIQKLQDDMRDLAIAICNVRDDKKKKNATDKFRDSWIKCREEVKDLIRQKQTYLSNTVESRADDEKIKLKLSLCVKYEDGTPVWGSIEEIEEESDIMNMNKILSDAMMFWAGLNTEIIDSLPDQVFDSIGEALNQKNIKT